MGLSVRGGRRRLLLLVAIAAVLAMVAAACRPSQPKNAVSGPQLFVFAGQSNMVALGTSAFDLSPEVQSTFGSVFAWDLNGHQWQHLNANGDAAKHFGPDLSALPELRRRLSVTVGGVKIAAAATSLHKEWRPPDGVVFKLMMSEVQRALDTTIPGEAKSSTLAAVFWIQGEGDALDRASSLAYAANLTKVVTLMRKNFHQPHLPFVFAKIRDTAPVLSQNGPQVNAALVQVAKRMGNATT
ncbi:MAG: hypothetical protein JO087_21955, partial [Actinobacteria bacterium]|nr:hypothetical protein [Actinomycetota bacterium]